MLSYKIIEWRQIAQAKPAAQQAGFTPLHRTFDDHYGHIVMLWRSRHECIRIRIKRRSFRSPAAANNLLPTPSGVPHPFFIGQVHRLADSVREEHHHVPAGHLNAGLRISRRLDRPTTGPPSSRTQHFSIAEDIGGLWPPFT